MKILVIGFQRGGTTLLRRLLDNHPNIQCMIHEKRILSRKDSGTSLLKKLEIDPNGNWGEKVPWNSGTGNEIIKYANKWLTKFGDEARVVHIVRHPVDSGLSNQRLGWMTLQDAVDRARKSIPLVIKAFKDDDRYLAVAFEELVTNPEEVLKKIFKFCGLSNGNAARDVSNLKKDALRYYDGIKASKAYEYKKKKNLNCKIPDYNRILRMIDELPNA
jgi:hypothetical protein